MRGYASSKLSEYAMKKKRNAEAAGLKEGQFRQQVIPSKRKYDRKKLPKPTKED